MTPTNSTAISGTPAGDGRHPSPLRRVPTVLQMEATECGAASLAMVLAAHGRFEPLDVLRDACGVSRDGARASNVARAARRYGLAARGWRLEPAELWDRPMPAIVHWEFDHFVVLEGRNRRGVHLNDPARGRRIVTAEEFDRGFTGVALTFTPTDAFAPGGHPYRLGPALARRLRGSSAGLLQAGLAGVLLLVPGIAVAGLTRVFVDSVLVAGLLAPLPQLVAAAICCAAAIGVLTLVQRRALVRAQITTGAASTARFTAHLLQLPPRFFAQRLPGDLAARVLANTELATLVLGQIAASLISALAVVVYVALMAAYDLTLTAVAVAAVLADVILIRLVAARRATAEERLLIAEGQLRGTTVEGVQNIETLKAAGAEADLFLRWTGQAARASAITTSLTASSALLQALPTVFAALSTAAVLYLGGRSVIDGDLSLGDLVAYQVLLAGLLAPVQQLTGLGRLTQRVGASLRRLDDVLDNPAEPAPDGDRPAHLRGQVDLQHVDFGYSPTAPPLLRDVTLSVRPGSRTALVGGSGSGKSTLARLLVGLESPWSGAVTFDGSVAPRSVPAGSVGYVDQDVLLFEGTIADNLTLWDDTVPEPVVVQAARDACLHDDIVARAGAYQGEVDDGGRNFSGGQRQRLEIARALVTNPAVLVLDEATSALDPLVEQAIDANLRRRGCTCVVVAHRLSTIRDADEIVVLERGQIVERGTHEVLVAARGAYLQLVQAEEDGR